MSCQEVSPPAYFFGCCLHCRYKGGRLKIYLTKLKDLSWPISCFHMCVCVCAHAPGGSSVLPVSASEQSTRSLLETPQITALHLLGHRCLAIGEFSEEQSCMVLGRSQLFGCNPLLHASFHLRQTDGNTFARCIRMAAMRFCSLNQNVIFHLSVHRDCHRAN